MSLVQKIKVAVYYIPFSKTVVREVVCEKAALLISEKLQ